MSQIVGSTFRSRIPTFNDDASIEEALRVYHYGVDNYSTQPIPNDSIEGNFRTLTTNLNTLDGAAIKRVSLTSAPNIITPQAINVVPITVRAIASQTVPLQIWQNSSSIAVGQITTAGSMFLRDTLAVGSSTTSTTSYLFINQSSASVKGVEIRAASGSTSSLQEWQNNSGVVLSSIDQTGKLIAKNIDVLPLEGQEGNLQEWKNSSGAPLSWVDPEGRLYIRETDAESLPMIASLMLMGG